MSRTSVRRLARAAVVGSLVVAAVAVALVAAPGDSGRVIHAAPDPMLGAGGEYHAITPQRVYDSRQTGRLATGPGPITFDVPIVGKGGLPAPRDTNDDGFDDDVLAVAMTITVILPDHAGYVTAYGTGARRGTSSVVNFSPGQVVANTALLRPAKDGKLSLEAVTPAGPGDVDIAIDVFGWFSSSTCAPDCFGARLIPAGPGRIFDSRLAQFHGGQPLGNRETVTIPIWGARSLQPAGTIVPNNRNITGVMVNITGVNAYPGSLQTHLSAIPDAPAPGAVPSTSNVNLSPGDVRATTAIVPVGTDGKIRVFNFQGSTHLVVDVVGYLDEGFEPESRQGRVVPLEAPFRAFDTREAAFGDAPLGSAHAESWSFQSFANDVQINGEPIGPQLGLVGNLTATGLGRRVAHEPVQTFLTAYPANQGLPLVSNINIGEGDSRPNLTLLRYGPSGGDPYQVSFYNLNGDLDYLLDASAVILAD